MLTAWDGSMDRGRPEPLIFSRWFAELEARVYADEFGPLFHEARRLRPAFMHRVLTSRHAWCDDVTTAAVEGCGALIAEALDATARALSEAHGEDPATWRWGDAHYAHMKHLPFSFIPFSTGFSICESHPTAVPTRSIAATTPPATGGLRPDPRRQPAGDLRPQGPRSFALPA